jgi:hypothetical protein
MLPKWLQCHWPCYQRNLKAQHKRQKAFLMMFGWAARFPIMQTLKKCQKFKSPSATTLITFPLAMPICPGKFLTPHMSLWHAMPSRNTLSLLITEGRIWFDKTVGTLTPHSHLLGHFAMEKNLSLILPIARSYVWGSFISAHNSWEKLMYRALGPLTPLVNCH